MKNSMLIRRPISDGSSEYTVRIPIMTEWTQDETLATESYVTSAVSQKTVLYQHSFIPVASQQTFNISLYWVDNNEDTISDVTQLKNRLLAAVSIWGINQQNRRALISVGDITTSGLQIYVTVSSSTQTKTISSTVLSEQVYQYVNKL